MMRMILSLFLLAQAATAFTVPQPAQQQSTARFMFSESDADKYRKTAEPLQPMESSTTTLDKPAALEEVSEGDEEADAPKQLVKNLNTGEVVEVAWQDPYMSAQSGLDSFSPLAIALLTFPAILLANDVFHFIPPNSPLSFVTHY